MKTAISMLMFMGALAAPMVSMSFAAEALPSGLTAEAITNAKTPADHQAISEALAKAHHEMAETPARKAK